MRCSRLGVLALLFTGLGCKGTAFTLPTNDASLALYCTDGYTFVPNPSTVNPAAGYCVPTQTVIAQGVISDAASGLPLPGVTVTIAPFGALASDGNGVPQVENPNQSRTVLTDINGYFVAHGLLTTSNVEFLLTCPGYFPSWGSSAAGAGVGGVVVNFTTSMTPMPNLVTIAGIVYAGDAPANKATVQLWDTSNRIRFTTLTDASGHYTFTNVIDGTSYTVRVQPFDLNNDGVADYQTTSASIGTPFTYTSGSLTNVVVPLVAITKVLSYTNLLSTSTIVPISTPPAGICTVKTGLRLAKATSPLVFQFSQAIQPGSFVAYLRPFENPSAPRYGAPIAVGLAWSANNTAVTITPTAAFPVDSDLNTGFELKIKTALWEDGTTFVSDSDPAACLAFQFDVGTVTPLIGSPTPQLYIGNKRDTVQTATQTSCDAAACWFYDAQGYYFSAYSTPNSSSSSMASAFNGVSGFQMTWPAVAGAQSYNVYARQRNTNHSGHDHNNWYLVQQLAGNISPVDPSLSGVVYASNLFSGSSATPWSTFGFSTGGPLSYGNHIDVAVTAVDYNSYESILDTSKLLTLSDVTPAALDSVNIEPFSNALDPEQATSTELGSSAIKKVVQVNFSEVMNANTALGLSVSGGMVTSVGAATLASWDGSNDPARPENSSASVLLGPLPIAIRGACSQITCAANAGTPGDSRICVADASLFTAASAKVFFVDAVGNLLNMGASATTWLTVSQANTSTNILSFTSPVQGSISVPTSSNPFVTPAFVCSAQAVTGNVAAVQSANTGTVVTVDNASIFYYGQQVMTFDSSNSKLFTSTVAAVNTVTNKVTLFGTPGTALTTSAVLLTAPTTSEYGFRSTYNAAVLSQDVVSGNTTKLVYASSLQGSTVMVGDLVLVDLDGNLRTVADKYFGKVSEVVVDTTTPDYHIVIGAPPSGMPAVPSSITISHSSAVVVHLGDTLSLTAGGAAPLLDTSGNSGLNPFRDQFSVCSSCGGYLYY